ncbi:TM0106 family RecB-like putative nuclease [Flavihumibacter sediminis]|nr:TM0106 family RecB-like putative nuclease [Flavihumibacter sediminis]
MRDIVSFTFKPMRISDSRTVFSASDLSNHLACAHLSWLNQQVALNRLEAPVFIDPSLQLLQERGMSFEESYLQFLCDKGSNILTPAEAEDKLSFERTASAMQEGYDVIYQATLKMDNWQGRADFLLRVEKPGTLGGWSYEVLDTKLARETRAGTILQICLYSQMLEGIQGIVPEYMHVITPTEDFQKQSYRVNDFISYTRLIRRRLCDAIELGKDEPITYPLPTPHCDICKWWKRCDNQRRDDDHLSLVAGLSGNHTIELNDRGIITMKELSIEPLPLKWRPGKGAVETYTKLREQARVQVMAREKGEPVFEVLELDPAAGLFRLPAPSAGDIFFDFEGDPFAGTNGIEYLFGWTSFAGAEEAYQCLWALDSSKEKESFENFIDWVMDRWEKYPDLHIYHYTPYEPAALKRVMGKYATRENEMDILLRAGIFVDLYSITRHTLRAGIEAYSLKELEVFHGFKRKLALRDASLQLRAFEQLLESGNTDSLPTEMTEAIELYNKEDCQSTWSLRQWLEKLRTKLVNDGNIISRPELKTGEASEGLTAYQESIKELVDQLTTGVDIEKANRTREEHAKWLLANMLDWYRREKKALWWEFFRLRELPDLDLLEEKTAIACLSFTGERQTIKKRVIDRYSFPTQESELKAGDTLKSSGNGEKIGEVYEIDYKNNWIDIKKSPKIIEKHPASIFTHKILNDKVKEDAIRRLGEWVVANGIDADGAYRAGRDLLLGLAPRANGEIDRNLPPQELAVQWVQALDRGVLPIQGPPGTGKSHTAAMMILSLIKSGKKVGITALSHKVIEGLLEKVVNTAKKQKVRVKCVHKDSGDGPLPAGIIRTNDNKKVLELIQSNEVQVIGGTAWLWAREELASSVDVLFVDEAGQLSLIDTLAVSQAAKSMVLLGDPQQLKQPQQGSHPEGTEVSALEHILGEHQTIPKEKGIFLDTTWRMHPDICSFISEQFYEGRLFPKETLQLQAVTGNTRFGGAGLIFVPVEHKGNQNVSLEEAYAVRTIIDEMCASEVVWIDDNKKIHPFKKEFIKVISPYNAQVGKLGQVVPDGIQVGTVDKFQGQEAPVIIYSMASSTPADAPRGMEFLYSLNRLNVAVSRARGICILVASPMLFEPDCKNPAQMRLANAFCRYLEIARTVRI